MEVCYIVRKNMITSVDLDTMSIHLQNFYEYRAIFVEEGVRVDISLPRQHALMHYGDGVRMFGSPNGVDSSITEAKHIESVKKVWRRSSRNDPLPQMLKLITRLDKMAAIRRKFERRGMLRGSCHWYATNLDAGTLPEWNPEDNEYTGEDEECGPL